ncbi:MAG TPA: nuclear transport factor 2 family protein [Chthoniobacterales bacterium]|jgi:ketosteroid isomerase-like protein
MKSLKSPTLLAVVVASCALLHTTSAPASDKPMGTGEVKANLKQMENTWGDAMLHKDHGVSVIRNLVADDFAGVNSKGKMLDKSGMLKEMENETDTLSASTTDRMVVHVYGPNLATVAGISTEKGKDKDGKAFSHTYGWVDTWVQRDGKWQCVAEAGSLLPEKK